MRALLISNVFHTFCCREYDRMSAYELFASCGVSKKLYDTFLLPMLLVTLFAPPTQLSAAAALGKHTLTAWPGTKMVCDACHALFAPLA
jgi:hypothetical protein